MRCSHLLALYLLLVVYIQTSAAYTGSYVNHTFVVSNTTYGKVRGMRTLQTDGKYLNVFLGIPFAAPPTGQLRFAEPMTPDSWQGVRDAYTFKSACPQQPLFLNGFGGGFNEFDNFDEDCLYLNIFAPDKTDGSSLLPVMVWIHGGCFGVGTAEEYDGSVLAQNGVIVVTVNYRLAAFGFLSTADEVAPGNWGLYDNVLALEWVRDNIVNFGGDPQKVTIFGQSAGAALSSLLMFPESARGLFHGVITISGNAMAPWAMYRQPFDARNMTNQLVQALSCSGASSKDSIDCLRSKTWEEIATVPILPYTSVCAWMPIVDGRILSEDPRILLEKKLFADVPLISGSTKDEQGIELYNMTTAMFEARVQRLVESHFGYTGNGDAILDALLYEYTDAADPGNLHKIRNQYVALMTDYTFTAPIDSQVKGHSSVVESTYKYAFHYMSENNPNAEHVGVLHSQDLLYHFGTPFWGPNRTCPWGCYNNWYGYQDKWTDTDRDMSELIMKLFTSFAKYGNPTPSPINGLTWTKFDEVTDAYMELNEISSMKEDYRAREMLFWEDYFKKVAFRERSEPIVLTPEPCDEAQSKSPGKFSLSRSAILLVVLSVKLSIYK
ncbi:neuroligin-4, X-linked-like [Ptychodera flava]|uniref:neuroligin-4, X-linked-like n=1 Tax=Ptychodera flava TaxID=63121 RepID=UPI00396A4D48